MPWNPNGPVSDAQSPTALILAYLASKGLPPTAQNVSQVLQLNTQNPGVIPGLTNQAPPAPDAPASTSNPSSPTIPVPPQPPQQAMPTPPIPPQQQAAQIQGQPPQQEQGGSNWLTGLLQSILGGGAAVGLGAMRPNIQSSMGNQPMPPTGRMIDVPGAAISGPGQQALPSPPITEPPHGPTPPMPENGSGVNWGKVLGEIAPLLKGAAR